VTVRQVLEGLARRPPSRVGILAFDRMFGVMPAHLTAGSGLMPVIARDAAFVAEDGVVHLHITRRRPSLSLSLRQALESPARPFLLSATFSHSNYNLSLCPTSLALTTIRPLSTPAFSNELHPPAFPPLLLLQPLQQRTFRLCPLKTRWTFRIWKCANEVKKRC
jgi:hypothetical protein